MKTKSPGTRKSNHSTAAPNRGVQLVFGILFIAVGALLTASFLMTANKLIGSGSWVETPCEVTSAEILQRRKRRAEYQIVGFGRQRERKRYRSGTLRFHGFFGEAPDAGSQLARSLNRTQEPIPST